MYWSLEKKGAEPRDAWISVLRSVCRVIVKADDSIPLVKYYSFRSHFCLSLQYLQESAVWEDVEVVMKPSDNQLCLSIIVLGNYQVAMFRI